MLIAGPCQIESLVTRRFAQNGSKPWRRMRVWGLSISPRTTRQIALLLNSARCKHRCWFRYFSTVKTALDALFRPMCIVQINAAAAEVVDIIQIPAFCVVRLICWLRPRKLVLSSISKRTVFGTWDMEHVAAKVSVLAITVFYTERGTTFGYNTWYQICAACQPWRRLAFRYLDAAFGAATGRAWWQSGGQREFVPVLARAVVAVGVNGLFIESHEDRTMRHQTGRIWCHLMICRKFYKN